MAGPRCSATRGCGPLNLEGDGSTPSGSRGTKIARSTDEVSVFEMVSRACVSDHPARDSSKSATTRVPARRRRRGLATNCSIEVQHSSRREFDFLPAGNGADSARVASFAVREARGFSRSGSRSSVNLVGGLRVREPAADLALAVALASALRDEPADPRTVFVGELGLGGELRRVQRVAARLKEAQRLGFERAVVPQASLGDLNGTGLEVIGAPTLREALMRSGIADP